VTLLINYGDANRDRVACAVAPSDRDDVRAKRQRDARAECCRDFLHSRLDRPVPAQDTTINTLIFFDFLYEGISLADFDMGEGDATWGRNKLI
jgi:hypothetical protein